MGHTHSLKGPLVTQPPPVPGGMKIMPAPARLPLSATYDPSPLMLVSLPSKTGDLRGSSVCANQFQYYQGSAEAHNKIGMVLMPACSYRLEALVRALVSQGRLVRMDKISMPTQKVPLATRVSCLTLARLLGWAPVLTVP